MARTLSSSLRLTALAFAGASLITIAACSDEDTSANAIVQPDAGESAASTTGAGASTGTDASETAETPDASAESDTAAASSQSTLTPAAEAPEPSGTVDVADLMADQPVPDVVIGDENAPVTIVEYASMTCGHCADFHENSYPDIKAAYLDTGKAKLILREFPFDPVSLAAFMLGRCAGDDARRTAMLDVLFEQQDSWARAESPSEALLKIARMAGMGQDEFVACLNNKELQEQIVETQQRGQQEFGVEATPTFFVNGAKFSGTMTPETMAAAIEAATPTN